MGWMLLHHSLLNNNVTSSVTLLQRHYRVEKPTGWSWNCVGHKVLCLWATKEPLMIAKKDAEIANNVFHDLGAVKIKTCSTCRSSWPEIIWHPRETKKVWFMWDTSFCVACSRDEGEGIQDWEVEHRKIGYNSFFSVWTKMVSHLCDKEKKPR